MTAVFSVLAALALAGAVAVIVTRDVMRLVLGLGITLLALAGMFGLLGFGFLAVAEVFLYVGGVLVVFLFAIMLVHRAEEGRPELESRHGAWPAIVSAAMFAALVWVLAPAAGGAMPKAIAGDVDLLAGVMLQSMLPHFEVAGVLLLAALAAVVALMAGGQE
jgi:NADH-quinone oxidoreductase subunit J